MLDLSLHKGFTAMIDTTPAALLALAREATNKLRDAVTVGCVIEFRERDPLVLAIHAVFDAYERALAAPPPPQGQRVQFTLGGQDYEATLPAGITISAPNLVSNG